MDGLIRGVGWLAGWVGGLAGWVGRYWGEKLLKVSIEAGELVNDGRDLRMDG